MIALRVALAVLLWATGSAAWSADGGGRFPVRVYRDLDGLPQNTVHAITIDREGLLWIGTQDGAAVWDGRDWRAVAMPDRATSNFVRAIHGGRDGSLWFGTQAGGIHRLLEGRWERHEPRVEGLPSIRINALLETEQGLVAATHEAGLAILANGTWQRLSQADGLPSERVWSLARGSWAGEVGVWAACEGGLAFVNLVTKRVVVESSFPIGHVNSVAAFTSAAGEEVWAGAYGAGVHRYAQGAWSHFGTAQGLVNLYPTSLAVEPAGPDHGPRVWIGTDGGGLVGWREGEGFEVYGTAEGLPSEAVYSLLVTQADEGAQAIWVGTRNGGLARLREQGWRAISPVREFPKTAVTALAEESGESSALWIGTDGAGVVRWQGERQQRWSTQTGLPSDFVQALAVRGSGASREVWVGLRNGGLARIAASGQVVQTLREAPGGLPSDLVQALLDVDGTLWVGTREGLALLRPDGNWERLPGLPPLSVTALRRGSGDTVWVGTSAGLLRVVGTRFDILDRRDGLVNTGILSLLETTSSAGERLLWVGTDGGGLAIFGVTAEPQLMATFSSESEPPLPNDVVSGLAQGPDGAIWVASNRGVAELTLTGAGVGFGPPLHVHSFGTEDGLPALASNRGALLLDQGGRLWVGTVEGTAYLDQGSVREEDRTAKKLILRSAVVDGLERRASAEGVVLAPEDRNLVLDFALLSYFREHDTRYRTQLLGLEVAPSGWQASGRRELTGLAPGHYVLQVQGRDFEGNVSRPLEVAIEVEADFWDTLMRTAAVPLLLVVLGGALWAWQRRRRDAVEVRLQAHADLARAAAERTRELLARCGLVDTVSGLANDVALGLLAERPATNGAALVLLGLRDRSLSADEAVQFEVRAAEVLAAEAPVGAEVGRFEQGVAWAWLAGASAEAGRALATAARGRLAGSSVAAVCAASPAGEPTALLPDRAAEALGTARRTGLLADG